MKKYVLISILTALLLLSAGCIIEKRVEKGDTVKVDYIGKLQDGKIFDTSILEEAKNAGVYNENRIYEPLTLKIGDGSTIPGFENGLIGMKEGETKTITIPPEQGYGAKDPTLRFSQTKILEEIPKTQEISRFEEIPRTFQATVSSFVTRYGKQPTVGMIVDLTDWPGQVVEVTASNVIIEHKPEVGKSIVNEVTTLTITEIKDSSIVLRYDPKVGDIIPSEIGDLTVLEVTDTTMVVKARPQKQIETVFGMANVIESGDKYIIKVNPKVGDSIIYQNQIGKVVEVTSDSFIVDFNHPLAGETLYFTVTTVVIEKGKETGFFEKYRLFIFGSLLIVVFAAAYIFMTKFYSKEEKEKKKEKSTTKKIKAAKEVMNGELKELASTVEEVEKELKTKKETKAKKEETKTKPKAKKKTSKKKKE
ncbi:MAG: FKBP-type peptidyl-prolyl cis-trans isomerase [Candidatus Methanofastidiosum methylothiophilum]|uniref:peptidylprolyl isomerase n=1 Tax=Candidatus Methanofastidiosum methylothiophilum TaxID=1705564 RepID=A0A150JI20_9EURY|nr:MAG: FKBP-type peptidyl-prolyl cis-trans isomerase [Candidatus Methanofastidiosum methylthiophilus]OQC51858.1 MAG: FKBP-type peptidyl-prolyl cis-trans isomerase [Euryarchaeota archaeon ADurb.Bin023]HOE93347.1 FKBP-type peptidyl-prolyl cis-trans isomerase [Methanofastidiosum sp.]KYC56836.1 MAG: FKBP-type peptidyl-prolyl cis-trans isomerase [Candidatus Methanofastidiosum methylthiophilus]KYC58661.1 MAG: FKBP-type peptidyl-prolyl cis-trans isomerase [Candidatus Methanofastidiosum methylthiophil